MSAENHQRKIIEYWRKLSEYDFGTAKNLFEAKRYPYCLFFCHLAIEKILKALVVREILEHAPYTHNLVDLAKKTNLDFSEEQKTLLADLTEFNLEARYPEWKKEFYKKATKAHASAYLNETARLRLWLKKQL